MTYREALAAFKREYWEKLLAETNGSIPKAARNAGVNRTDIYKVLATNGLKKPRPPATREKYKPGTESRRVSTARKYKIPCDE